MLRRSKTLSIVMSLCLCLAMLAPVFVAPQAADAAGSLITYSEVTTTPVETNSEAQPVNMNILIDIPETAVFTSTYSFFSIQLPAGVEFDKDNLPICKSLDVAKVTAAPGYPKLSGKDTVDFAFYGTETSGETKLQLSIQSLVVKSGSGDIKLKVTAPTGSVFPDDELTIGKIVSEGTTTTRVSKVVNMGDSAAELGEITIEESMRKLVADEVITLKINTKGFKWIDKGEATGGWGFSGTVGTTDIKSDKELTVTLNDSITTAKSPGKIQLSGLQIEAGNNASFGDVEINVSSNKDNVTDEDIVIAKYADYGVTVEEGTKENVTSGRTEQEIGEFYIKEGVAGSLLQNRSIRLELPDGVEWVTEEKDDKDVLAKQPKINFIDGSLTFKDNKWTIEDSDNQIIKATIDAPSAIDAANIKISDLEVKVKPDFEGPIEVTVSGSAGAKGTVVVAEAVKPVKISAENVKDIIVGQASQKVADIILTESDKDMIQDEEPFKDIVISLEDGYKFTSKPTVTVEEGNLEIDSTKLQNEDNDLKLVVKYGSTKASKIRISDVAITAYRYVPVGPVKATLVGADFDIDSEGNLKAEGGSTALVDWDTDKSMGNVVIANCVTPAEGASSQFKIGSNVYTVNGVAKIMDVAPYIKNSRTYVPVRYLAYALGVSESDVVWDAATNKVTITKGDKVVELTIGSTTITVNGEAQTMDVAPEIANSRTMLPARFVAEGLGATVGWDAATSTVYVQQ